MSDKRLLSLALLALTLLTLWQEVRIRNLQGKQARYAEMIFVVERAMQDIDWIVHQLPQHDGMRPSDFQR